MSRFRGFPAAPQLITPTRKRKQEKAEAQDAMTANDTREYIITTDGAVAAPPAGQVSHYRTASGWRQKDDTGTASDVGGGGGGDLVAATISRNAFAIPDATGGQETVALPTDTYWEWKTADFGAAGGNITFPQDGMYEETVAVWWTENDDAQVADARLTLSLGAWTAYAFVYELVEGTFFASRLVARYEDDPLALSIISSASQKALTVAEFKFQTRYVGPIPAGV